MKAITRLWVAGLIVGMGSIGTGTLAATTSDTAKQVSKQDETFARKAAEGSQAEMEMAQLAQQRASSQEVKQLADRLLKDHQDASQQLNQIAQSNERIEVPKQPSGKHEETIEELRKLSGSDFDKRFLEVQLKEHQKDIDAFRKEAEKGSNPQLKDFAAKTLPVLQEHLSLTKKAAKQKT